MSTPLPQACAAMLRRDLTLAWRRRGDLAIPVLYAVIVAVLFPFALGPDLALLQRIAGGVVLVTVLLAMLLALDGMFAGPCGATHQSVGKRSVAEFSG